MQLQLHSKKCAPFIKCITISDRTTTDDGEDLDLVIWIYNLKEYNSNYSDATSSLKFSSKDKATNFDADITDNNAFKSFEYWAKLLENTTAHGNNSKKMQQSLYH